MNAPTNWPAMIVGTSPHVIRLLQADGRETDRDGRVQVCDAARDREAAEHADEDTPSPTPT